MCDMCAYVHVCVFVCVCVCVCMCVCMCEFVHVHVHVCARFGSYVCVIYLLTKEIPPFVPAFVRLCICACA